MSAAEMREAAADRAERRGFATLAAEIRALPLPDEEGMVERVARAITRGDPDRICYRRCGHDGFEPIGPAWTLSIDAARAALRAINGGEPQ